MNFRAARRMPVAYVLVWIWRIIETGFFRSLCAQLRLGFDLHANQRCMTFRRANNFIELRLNRGYFLRRCNIAFPQRLV